MSTRWLVELAICWQDGTWTPEAVELDEDDFAHHDGEPSESEIWEAANDRWESEHRAASRPAHVATGLHAWQRDAHDHEEV
jgi:hypothetical protein